jgi:transcriptional regulator with XRE-family HTH domain
MGNYQAFGENLRRVCESHASVTAICKAIGMNRQQFSRYLSGQTLPNAMSLHKICSYLGVNEQDLLGGTDIDQTLAFQARQNRIAVEAFAFLTANDSGISFSIPSLKPGYYYCYTPFPAAPGSCVRSIIGIWERQGHMVFSRITRLTEPGTSGKFALALARHKGSVFATDNQIHFMAINRSQPRQLSLMTIDMGQLNNQDCFLGSIITRSSNGLLSTKFLMLPNRDAGSLRSVLNRLGIIQFSDPNLPHLVRVSLREEK